LPATAAKLQKPLAFVHIQQTRETCINNIPSLW